MGDGVSSIDTRNQSRYIDTCSEEGNAGGGATASGVADARAERAAARERYECFAESGSMDPEAQAPQDEANSSWDRVEQFIMQHGDAVAGELLWHSAGVGAAALGGPGAAVGVYAGYAATHAPSHDGEGARNIVVGGTMLIPH